MRTVIVIGGGASGILAALTAAEDPQNRVLLLERKDALILECFGVGGLPSYDDDELFRVLHGATQKGKFLVMTTQVQNEGSDFSVYSVGTRLKGDPHILEAYDMTTEAALAKIMWILGRTKEPAEVERLFYTPVAHDLLHRG